MFKETDKIPNITQYSDETLQSEQNLQGLSLPAEVL